MDVRKYIPAGATVQSLATMEQTEVGRIVLHALRVESQRRTSALKRSPRVNTEDMREDVRHKLGEIEGLEWLARLRAAAVEMVSGKPAKEDET